MHAIAQILTVTLKELRELLHRPMLVLTLILGPLGILIVFGIGSDATPNPPRAIVVIPTGQTKPRLLEEYRHQFDELLNVTAYTDDEVYARAQLGRDAVDAVLILPSTPFKTIAGGERATIQVLYNEIDPLWRWLVPSFVRTLAGQINHDLFLQNAGEQRQPFANAITDLDAVLLRLDQAIAATEREDWQEARQQVRNALVATDHVVTILGKLGPEIAPMRTEVDQARIRLRQADQLMEMVERRVTPDQDVSEESLGLTRIRRSIQTLHDAISTFTSIPPEVLVAPLAVEAEFVARFEPDFITFFAPAILALLLQHIAVSLGALALVRERLVGTFDLYIVAPISGLQLLLGKYVAYLLFTLVIAGTLLTVLLAGLDVPLYGSPWRLLLTLLLLAVASVGLGFALSLLATSERQAVQLSMLSLLGMFFFSGFALPLDALRQPALSISYVLPATYGVVLLQDVMLRGLPGSNRSLFLLMAMGVALFCTCYGLLRWRMRAH